MYTNMHTCTHTHVCDPALSNIVTWRQKTNAGLGVVAVLETAPSSKFKLKSRSVCEAKAEEEQHPGARGPLPGMGAGRGSANVLLCLILGVLLPAVAGLERSDHCYVRTCPCLGSRTTAFGKLTMTLGRNSPFSSLHSICHHYIATESVLL